ncbi:MAG TPA: AsmA family protein [Verrucomicrobiae bacterium]|jgi:AsmA protein|nr:AsmA family protein [Verrucomicrobiae bacterium]
MKRLFIIAGSIVGVIVLALLIVPLFINVDSFRPQIETKLSAALGRTVHVGKLEASIFSGGATASDISISDDPKFGKDPFLQAASVKVGLQMLPLIFSKQIKVTSLTVDSPDIVLLKNGAGKWNYSTFGTAAAKGSTPADSSPTDLEVGKVEIVNGKVRIAQSTGHAAGHERVYEKVHLVVRDISATTAMPFTLTASTPGGGTLDVEGQAGPLDANDTSKTPLQAKVKLEHSDLAASGLFDPSSGLAGVVDFTGEVKSDGRTVHSEGKGTANGLKLVKAGAPARGAIAMDYNSDFNLDSESGTVKADVHTGGSTATANGTLNAHGESIVTHMKIAGKSMAVNDVEGLLPAFGVTLPSGASLQGGTINMDLTADGPLDRLVITGPVNVAGTHLKGFDLASKLGAMGALSGIKSSNDTLIQTFNSALHMAPDGLRADNIFLDAPSMGQLTGNGVVGSNNSLNFKMSMKLAGGVASNAIGGLSSLTGQSQSKGGGIPFTITGSTASPIFLPDVGSALKNTVLSNNLPGPAQGVGDSLGGLFGKKKPK